MANINFEPKRYHRCFETDSPVMSLKSGDRVSTSTLDAHGYDHLGQKRANFSNPLIGPFFIEDLLPGDTLAIHFERIEPNNPRGWSYLHPLPTTVEPGSLPCPPAREILRWELDLKARTACKPEGHPHLARLTLPLSPMLGCIGVAPPMGQAFSSYTSGNFGGNMDCALFTASSSIYLPVFVEGGLLYLGDGHARQCDGEITGGAIEIACDLEFSVEIIKGQNIRWPRGENSLYRFTLGCSRPIEHCLQIATTEMHRWLSQDSNMDDNYAWTLMSQALEYQLCNTVSPNYTAACKLLKQFIPQT